MDSTLFVKLTLNSDCGLNIYDRSDYESIEELLPKYSVMEFLENADNEIVSQRLCPILSIDDPKLRSSFMDLSTDGTFYYYRLLVPQLSFFYDEEEHLYKVSHKYFVYNNDLYYSSIDFEELDLNQVRLVTNYKELWDFLDMNPVYWYTNKFFTVCRLNNCLIKLINNSVRNKIKNGCGLTCTNSEDQAQIDFLMETSFILKYLTERKRYEDAQRILNSLSRCGGLCNNEFNNNNTDCGCGKTLR